MQQIDEISSNGNYSDCSWNLSVQGEKCEFTRVNVHFLT